MREKKTSKEKQTEKREAVRES
jgi:hypothetical protein